MSHSVLLSVHGSFCHPVDCFLCYFVFNVNGKSVTSRSCAASDNSTLNNSSCESVMHQRSPHPCKNVRACQWIHKSSTIHMDALCDHMFHAFLSSLTLYCSAHLLISLRMPDDVLCSLSTGFSSRPWVLSPRGRGCVEAMMSLRFSVRFVQSSCDHRLTC